jgi:transposase
MPAIQRPKRRNQVERGYSRRKQFRALATRYDKLGSHWQATNDIIETIDWIRASPDKTQHDPADTP